MELKYGDYVKLLNRNALIEIYRDQVTEPFTGKLYEDDIEITFASLDIEEVITPRIDIYGSDGINYWMFYTGDNYNISKRDIAKYAIHALSDIFGSMSIDTIMSKHIYFGSNSSVYNAIYNGDTYVLFKDYQKLPEKYKLDAEYLQ